jgi:hypothetical protein
MVEVAPAVVVVSVVVAPTARANMFESGKVTLGVTELFSCIVPWFITICEGNPFGSSISLEKLLSACCRYMGSTAELPLVVA